MFANFFKNLIVKSLGNYIEVLTLLYHSLGLHNRRHCDRQVEWPGGERQRDHQEIGAGVHVHVGFRRASHCQQGLYKKAAG
jgi:hypothetical protein